jgi:meso-butanediol dehydrogenase/(S,S)-butanediol dehydrogenase/diacetyl reductase
MGKFSGKTAVITGSGREKGIGQAIAIKLASEGANIVISDIGRSRDKSTEDIHIGSTDAMEAVAKDLRKYGVNVTTCVADVRVQADMQALAAHAVAEHGSVDIWVNNAGIGYIMSSIFDVTEDDWRAVIDVNLTGCFWGLQAAAKVMIDQKVGGRIINIASQAAKSGFPFAQAYCASKHGLVGLTRSASIELGPEKITVNNVCPNHVTTGLGDWQNKFTSAALGLTEEEYLKRMRDKIPMRRVGMPEDTANAVAFLCSEDASYITGESLNVSGGEEPH